MKFFAFIGYLKAIFAKIFKLNHIARKYIRNSGIQETALRSGSGSGNIAQETQNSGSGNSKKLLARTGGISRPSLIAKALMNQRFRV